jgi:hypothetical protein
MHKVFSDLGLQSKKRKYTKERHEYISHSPPTHVLIKPLTHFPLLVLSSSLWHLLTSSCCPQPLLLQIWPTPPSQAAPCVRKVKKRQSKRSSAAAPLPHRRPPSHSSKLPLTPPSVVSSLSPPRQAAPPLRPHHLFSSNRVADVPEGARARHARGRPSAKSRGRRTRRRATHMLCSSPSLLVESGLQIPEEALVADAEA